MSTCAPAPGPGDAGAAQEDGAGEEGDKGVSVEWRMRGMRRVCTGEADYEQTVSTSGGCGGCVQVHYELQSGNEKTMKA